MQVGRIHVVPNRTLGAIDAVVAGASEDLPEGSDIAAEFGQAGMILEADDRPGALPDVDLTGRMLHEALGARPCLEIE